MERDIFASYQSAKLNIFRTLHNTPFAVYLFFRDANVLTNKIEMKPESSRENNSEFSRNLSLII